MVAPPPSSFSALMVRLGKPRPGDGPQAPATRCHRHCGERPELLGTRHTPRTRPANAPGSGRKESPSTLVLAAGAPTALLQLINILLKKVRAMPHFPNGVSRAPPSETQAVQAAQFPHLKLRCVFRVRGTRTPPLTS